MPGWRGPRLTSFPPAQSDTSAMRQELDPARARCMKRGSFPVQPLRRGRFRPRIEDEDRSQALRENAAPNETENGTSRRTEENPAASRRPRPRRPVRQQGRVVSRPPFRPPPRRGGARDGVRFHRRIAGPVRSRFGQKEKCEDIFRGGNQRLCPFGLNRMSLVIKILRIGKSLSFTGLF